MGAGLHSLPNVTATEIDRPAQSKKLARLNPPTLQIAEKQDVDKHIFDTRKCKISTYYSDCN